MPGITLDPSVGDALPGGSAASQLPATPAAMVVQSIAVGPGLGGIDAAGRVSGTGDSVLVTATGALTARSLADRFAQFANSKDYGDSGAAMLANIANFTDTIAASTINTPQLWLQRTDDSPPAGLAGILNPYATAQMRLELVKSGGGVQGSGYNMILRMPDIKGKTLTTLTAPVVGSGIAQTVAVADSSVVIPGEIATVSVNLVDTEAVVITAVPDGTHITGIFTKSHASGARLYVDGKGFQNSFGVSMYDQVGNSNSMYCENLNVIARSVLPLAVVGSEFDITNDTGHAPGLFYGDGYPFIAGLSLVNAGAGDASAGLVLGTLTASRFLVGIDIEGAKNYGLVVGSGPSGAAATGIAVQGAVTNGLVIGSNQTPAGNPLFTPADPTVGILLTSRGATGSLASNLLRFQELITSVSHTWDIQANSAQLRFSHDGSWQGTAINTDGTISTEIGFALRDNTETNIGFWINSGGTSVLKSTVFETDATAAASIGDVRFGDVSSLYFRNHAGSGDVLGISKDAADVVHVGGAAGVAVIGLNAGSQKVTNVTDPASAQDAATKAYVDGRTAANISSFGTNVASDSDVSVAQRLSRGGVTILVGGLVSASGTVAAGSTLCTLDAAYRPNRTVVLPALSVAAGVGTACYVTITAGGVLTCSVNLVNAANSLRLDNLTWSVT